MGTQTEGDGEAGTGSYAIETPGGLGGKCSMRVETSKVWLGDGLGSLSKRMHAHERMLRGGVYGSGRVASEKKP